MGYFFEQWVGLEILRNLRFSRVPARLRFWRDPDGPEVDWVIEREESLIPIEVKWTEKPALSDARHLKTFLVDYQQPAGYIVCRCARARKLDEHITAIPWQQLVEMMDQIFKTPEK